MERNYQEASSIDVLFLPIGQIDGDRFDYPTLQRSHFGLTDESTVGVFFDNEFSHDLLNSVWSAKLAFQCIVNLLKSNKDLVFLYKPKSGDMSRVHDLGIYDELRPLIEDRRFIPCIGERSLSNSAQSFQEFVNFSVGFPISSAVIELQVKGVPGFHFNFTGFKEHFLDKEFGGRFIFHDPRVAENVINQFIVCPSQFSFDRSKIDFYFNFYGDNKSIDRMDRVITFLCENNMGLTDLKENLAKLNLRTL